MKQQADRAAGLDVHRDSVVAATRISEPGGEVTVTKKRFPTTRRGIGELAGVPGGSRRHQGGLGGDGGVLEGGLLRP